MEALAAVGLASAVVQFVQFTSKVASKTHEFQETVDGNIKEHVEIETYVKKFRQHADNLRKVQNQLPEQQALSPVEIALVSTVHNCQNVGEEIQQALGQLLKSGHAKAFRSFRQGLKAVWNERKIENCLQRLRRAREELMENLLVVLSSHLDNLQASVTKENRSLEANFLEAIEKSQIIISGRLLDLAEMMRNIDPLQRRSTASAWCADNKEDIRELDTVLNDLSIEDERHEASERLLTTLYFERMFDREHTIVTAHAETFAWIFDPNPRDRERWTPFAPWLGSDENEKNLYWITGKAGSGKSTLMKHIRHDERTASFQNQWGGSRKVLTASCFFWYSGHPMQKSRHGLLRSLLYQFLFQAPHIIQHVCPTRMRAHTLGIPIDEPWTDEQLLNTLSIALRRLSEEYKLCIFIDGLDEYEGNTIEQHELVARICALQENQNVKLCVSSRDLVVFRDAFGKGPSLELHRMTEKDISSYVEAQLVQSEHFALFSLDSTGSSDLIVQEIVNKAQGVFLWVYLVIRELLQCLRNGDSINDLRRTVHAIPRDLDEFFDRMLGRLEKPYFEQACKLLLVATTVKPPASLLVYSFMLEDDPAASLTRLDTFTKEQLEARCRRMEWQLNSRCRGLLEVDQPFKAKVTSPSQRSPSRVRQAPTIPVESEYLLVYQKPPYLSEVRFFHKSASDYLNSGALRRLCQVAWNADTKSIPFDANEALAFAYLSRFKTIINAEGLEAFHESSLFLESCLDDMFSTMARYEMTTGKTLMNIVDALHYLTVKADGISLASKDYFVPWLRPRQDATKTLFYYALDKGLFLYCLHMLNHRELYTHMTASGKAGLLGHVLRAKYRHFLPCWGLDSDFIRDLISDSGDYSKEMLFLEGLLDKDADPNLTVGKFSPWQLYVSSLFREHAENPGLRCNGRHRKAVHLMVAHGAARIIEYNWENDRDNSVLPKGAQDLRLLFEKIFGEDFAQELGSMWDKNEGKGKRSRKKRGRQKRRN